MIAVAIINYRTHEATQNCLAALLPELPPDAIVHLLDNGSGAEELQRLHHDAHAYGGRVQLGSSTSNLGFAGGMNQLLTEILARSEVDQVLLLNNDTRVTPGFLGAMQAQLDPLRNVDMVAARLLKPSTDAVDSLGITLYRSTLASNRKRVEEVLLGPTGGCALLSRRLLEDVHLNHGEWFDDAFFCYAEDTDLMVRARWLGWQAGYADDARVYHIGSLSSGGADSDFILYHGIRNSLWWLAKNAPTGWLLRSLPWLIALHTGICLRHLRRGRARVLWRLYRDALHGLPDMLRKRRIIRDTRREPAAVFRSWVEPHFYERDYLQRAWRELWKGAPK